MQRQLNGEPFVMSVKLPPSAEPPKPNSNYPALQPQNKGTAAITAEVAHRFAVCTYSPQIMISILFMFAAEEAQSTCLIRSADSTNSFSEAAAKKMKLENLMPVSDTSATATAYIHAQQIAVSAPQPFQTVLVQQAPIQNQTLLFQAQYNLYQSSAMQYLQPYEGEMTGLLDSYNAEPPPPPSLPPPLPPPPPPPPPLTLPPPPPPLTPPPPTPPPPPPPHPMMNLMTMPVSWTQQQLVASVQQLPMSAPPPSMPLYHPLPINQQPTNQSVSIDQQPSQFSIQKPMAPSYRPLLPSTMSFYH